MQTSSSLTVSQQFLQPIFDLLRDCRHVRTCPKISDSQWLSMALTRVLHECKSGRAFLQEFGTRLPMTLEVSSYFESLKSARRLALLQELNTRLVMTLEGKRSHALSTDKALKGFDVYAGDGHWHGAAAHDPVIDDTKHAVGHFFGLNLRSYGVVHLTSADQQARKHEHDMRALKRLPLETLRQNATKGRRVIWVWDKAGISFQQWHKWKHAAGVYFISRVKENMKLEACSGFAFDRKDPVNVGVIADQLVGTSQGVMMRRVRYQDPLTRQLFEFVTSEHSLQPGCIAHLYRLRWNIEKVFDEFKNKLSETKSWASHATAKQVQGQLVCLVHNLMQLFEQRVLIPAGVLNQVEDRRRNKRIALAKKEVEKRKDVWPTLMKRLLRCTQVSVKFIRWLRAHFFSPTSCDSALDSLRVLYAKL